MALKTAHSGIKDMGDAFEIDPRTRSINVPEDYRVIGTVGEHNSEQITIKCPKTIDNHDISGCAMHYVTWENAEGTLGNDDLHPNMSVNGDFVFFKWTIRDALTTSSGQISFSVHFEDPSDDSGEVYKFNTAICKDCKILDSHNIGVATYESIYVSGTKLVIADYTPVIKHRVVIKSAQEE